MKALHSTLIVAISLGLAACASQPYPGVEESQTSSQRKIIVAQHWDSVAAQVAQRLSSALAASREGDKPLVLYLQRPRSPSVFEAAFHDLLVTRLLGEGFGVSHDPSVGLPVQYKAQVVTHRVADAEVPDSEIIVTTSVMSGDRFLARISDIYYVPSSELDTYIVSRGTPNRLMGVTGQ
jgi:hypothetical protein